MGMVVPPGFEPGSWDPEPHMMDHYTKGLMTLRDGISISRNPRTSVSLYFNLKLALSDSKLSLLGLNSCSGSAISGVSVKSNVSVAVFLSGL